MKQEIKVKWLQALRSGEYRQGRYDLRTSDNGFCCLGVLCDLYNREVGGEWAYEFGQRRYYFVAKNDEEGSDTSTGQLPGSVMEWAGLEGYNPSVNVARPLLSSLSHELKAELHTTLAELNDEGETFNRIADIIEHQL